MSELMGFFVTFFFSFFSVWINTADTMGIPLKTLGETQTIGPQVWS